MFTRNEENQLRFLDLRLVDWPIMLIFAGIVISPIVMIPFTGWSLIQVELALAVYAPIVFFGLRLFYRMGRSIGKPLNWDRLPEILPGMVGAKVFTKEQAVRIYDLFFYSSHPFEREWDLRSFAPLPPKKQNWFLEGSYAD